MAPRGSYGAGRNSGAQGSSHAAEQQQEPVNTNKRKSEVITLNLKLEKTDEFLKRLTELQEDDSEYYQIMWRYTRQTESEKLKASNFPALTIQIGDWHMKARSDNDLVAKFYFAKEQLLWEVLEHERGRKKKIEFNWTDISAIKAIFVEGEASSLHVENPPKFLLEDPPEPRRHVQWTAIPDFTNGHATRCRWHTLTFAEGILEKHFDKLVNSSGALFAKNQQPFPMESHPFFTEDQINESLNNQQDLINKQYSSTATCEGMIQTRQPPPVLMVPPIRQIPPEVPSQSFPPSVGSPSLQQSFTIPAVQYAPMMNEHAMATQSASNFPSISTSYGTGMNGSFPQQNDWRLKGHCLTTENQRQEQQPTSLTIENQRQEQPTGAYSTPAPNLFPRRVLVEPRMDVCASSIASSSSLNEVTRGIQTPEIFYLNNGQDYNFGSTNYPVPAIPFNQNEEHGAPAGGDIHMRNDGNVLESPTDINRDDELPEDISSFLNDEDDFLDIDTLDFTVDVGMDLEPNAENTALR